MSHFHESDDTQVPRRFLLASALQFGFIAVLIGVDVLSDYRAGSRPAHLLTELAVMGLAMAGVAGLIARLRRARREAARLGLDLAAAQAEARRFRQDARELLRGLGQAIDQQFARWNLTTAEREVALLLLKGLSHREIAELRATAETTVRQQALAVYRKSGLRGRSDLAAFFLEDLLLPPAGDGESERS